jgi:hypothetical protein
MNPVLRDFKLNCFYAWGYSSSEAVRSYRRVLPQQQLCKAARLLTRYHERYRNTKEYCGNTTTQQNTHRYTVFDPTNCIINNKQSCHIPSTYSDLYKVIIKELYTKAYKYSKLHQRCACVELKYNIVN